MVARSVTQLGFSPTGVPPETVSVALLQADGWAEQQGLAVGDVLYTVGMSAASELTKEEITRLSTRACRWAGACKGVLGDKARNRACCGG